MRTNDNPVRWRGAGGLVVFLALVAAAVSSPPVGVASAGVAGEVGLVGGVGRVGLRVEAARIDDMISVDVAWDSLDDDKVLLVVPQRVRSPEEIFSDKLFEFDGASRIERILGLPLARKIGREGEAAFSFRIHEKWLDETYVVKVYVVESVAVKVLKDYSVLGGRGAVFLDHLAPENLGDTPTPLARGGMLTPVGAAGMEIAPLYREAEWQERNFSEVWLTSSIILAKVNVGLDLK